VAFLIDTDIAINWRDRDPEVVRRTLAFRTAPSISIMTQIELTNGIHARPDYAASRQVGVEKLYAFVQTIPFDGLVAHAYEAILAVTGFSRARVFDRMIAATAIAHGLTLVTMNGPDFRDIPGLTLEIWPAPAAQ
jgi:tRNA(fMet)-specific endonuclease VapC